MAGSNKRQRGRMLAIRLTDAEADQLQAVANRAGLSLGGFARQALLDAPPPRASRRPPIERVELAKLLAHVGKLGSNINQLAKYGNLGRLVEDPHLAAAAADIAALRAVIMEALGRDP